MSSWEIISLDSGASLAYTVLSDEVETHSHSHLPLYFLLPLPLEALQVNCKCMGLLCPLLQTMQNWALVHSSINTNAPPVVWHNLCNQTCWPDLNQILTHYLQTTWASVKPQVSLVLTLLMCKISSWILWSLKLLLA